MKTRYKNGEGQFGLILSFSLRTLSDGRDRYKGQKRVFLEDWNISSLLSFII